MSCEDTATDKANPVRTTADLAGAETPSLSLDTNLSAPLRHAAELDAMEAIDSGLREIASSFGASEVGYPTLIASEVLHVGEYPQAFPHLLMAAAHPSDVSLAASDLLQAGNVETSPWCLSPAVCYHTYAELSGTTITEPTVITARGKCFRNESTREAGIRQVEFEMREIVLCGTEAWVDDAAKHLQHRIEELANELQIDGHWRTATDAFFLPQARGKALIQQLKQSKLEYQAVGDELAMASVNRHATFFGERFNIVGSDGIPVHTACVAIGLDRWLARARVGQSTLIESFRSQDLSAETTEILEPSGNEATSQTANGYEVLAQLRRRLPFLPKNVTPETPIVDLRLDSLDLVELLYVVDEEFHVRLSQDVLENANVVADLVEAVFGEMQNAKETP